MYQFIPSELYRSKRIFLDLTIFYKQNIAFDHGLVHLLFEDAQLNIHMTYCVAAGEWCLSRFAQSAI